MDQQVRDEHLDQAASHSVGHNTSQITAMFMIYGMVGSSMSGNKNSALEVPMKM